MLLPARGASHLRLIQLHRGQHGWLFCQIRIQNPWPSATLKRVLLLPLAGHVPAYSSFRVRSDAAVPPRYRHFLAGSCTSKYPFFLGMWGTHPPTASSNNWMGVAHPTTICPHVAWLRCSNENRYTEHDTGRWPFIHYSLIQTYKQGRRSIILDPFFRMLFDSS